MSATMQRVGRLGLLLCALVAAGCQRRTDIVVIPSDSTQSAAIDSSAIALREVQQLWESAGAEPAAAATARLLEDEFMTREPGAWRDRAGALLDSLSVGAEFGEAPCALMVNFFSRSDPEGGSWPYLYWCGTRGPSMQPVEGRNLHLQALLARGLVHIGVGGDSARRVAAAFVKRAAGGPQPLVMTWALGPKGPERWSLVQALGSDSLGGFGTATFEAVTDTGADLNLRTYRAPPGFVECATCPHAYTTARFAWTARGFVRAETEAVPSPYATFVAFIQALIAGNQPAAEDRVTDPTLVLSAQQLGWNVRNGAWRPAPSDDESPSTMTFFRGPRDAFAVHFRSQGRYWVITGFEPVARSVE